jgi:hypothetical protein
MVEEFSGDGEKSTKSPLLVLIRRPAAILTRDLFRHQGLVVVKHFPTLSGLTVAERKAFLVENFLFGGGERSASKL